MALSDGVETLAYSRFLIPYQQQNIWRGFYQDLSGEFPGYGQTLSLPTDDGSVPGDAGDSSYDWRDDSATYNVDSTLTQLTRPNPTLQDISTTSLTINQVRRKEKLVPWLAQERLRVNLLSSASMWVSRRIMEEINKHLRATMLAAPAVSQRPAITVTAANFATPNAAYKTALLNEFAEAELDFDESYIPMDERVAIVSPRIHKYLTDFLQEEKLFLVEQNPQFVIEGMTPRYKGWQIVKDVSAGKGVTAADDDKHAIFFLRRGEGLSFAGELSVIRVIEPERVDGWEVQGTFTWGAAVTEPSKLRVTKHNITA